MNFGGYNDGASQFAGGGFMPSPAPGNQAGGFGGGPVKRGSNNQTLRAVTIRQLLRDNERTDDDHFTVDGFEINVITIVGRVVHVNEQPTMDVITIDDGTSSIDVTHWNNDPGNDPAAVRRTEWSPGMYVRAMGNLKAFNGRKSINAYCVKPITDHNEVTYHFLQTVFQGLHLKRGAPPPAGMAQPAPTGAYGGAPQQQPAFNAPGAGFSAPPAAAGGAGGGIHADLVALYNAPEVLARNEGLSVDEARTSLAATGKHYSAEELKKAIDYLVDEGNLYSTVDDHHFRSTSV